MARTRGSLPTSTETSGAPASDSLAATRLHEYDASASSTLNVEQDEMLVSLRNVIGLPRVRRINGDPTTCEEGTRVRNRVYVFLCTRSARDGEGPEFDSRRKRHAIRNQNQTSIGWGVAQVRVHLRGGGDRNVSPPLIGYIQLTTPILQLHIFPRRSSIALLTFVFNSTMDDLYTSTSVSEEPPSAVSTRSANAYVNPWAM